MMTETEKFLEQYKRFESALRETNTADTVLDYENTLQADPVNSDTYDKLKTCRIIRNYIQHHPDRAKMFPASSQMTEFIKKQAELIESKIQKVSDIMTRQPGRVPIRYSLFSC